MEQMVTAADAIEDRISCDKIRLNWSQLDFHPAK